VAYFQQSSGFKTPLSSDYLLSEFIAEPTLGRSRYKPGNLLIVLRTAPPVLKLAVCILLKGCICAFRAIPKIKSDYFFEEH
jgi:hypothetical protein